MSKAPDTELQEVIYARLTADPTITPPVYANPPDDVTFPYIRFGNTNILSDDEECRDVSLVELRIHVFSRAGGYTEVRNIAHAVKKSLHDYSPVMVQHALRLLRAPRVEYVDDPDGLTVQAVVFIEAEIEESA
jgi:Protein of unknown function (DUF3168)